MNKTAKWKIVLLFALLAIIAVVLYQYTNRSSVAGITECIHVSDTERDPSPIGSAGTIRLALFGRGDTTASLYESGNSTAISPTISLIRQFMDTGEDYVSQGYIMLDKGDYTIRYTGKNDSGSMTVSLNAGDVTTIQIACP